MPPLPRHELRDGKRPFHFAAGEIDQPRLVRHSDKKPAAVHRHVAGVVRHRVTLRAGQRQPPQLRAVVGVHRDQEVFAGDDQFALRGERRGCAQMPVHHRGRAGAAEPLQHKIAVHECVAAVAGVGRVAVLVRPLARAGQAAGQARRRVRLQPGDAVMWLQQTLQFVLGQAARRLAKPRGLGDDEVGEIIGERQCAAPGEMHAHSTAVQPALGQALTRRIDFPNVGTHTDDAQLRLLRQRGAQSAVDHVGDQRPAAGRARRLGQALGQANRQGRRPSGFGNCFCSSSGGGETVQHAGVSADEQPPPGERQPARRAIDLGRPLHRAVRQRARLDKAVAAQHDAVGQGNDGAPARRAEFPLLRCRPRPVGSVERSAELAQLGLQPGAALTRQARFFQLGLQRLDAAGGAVNVGARPAVRLAVDRADAVFVQQKTVPRRGGQSVALERGEAARRPHRVGRKRAVVAGAGEQLVLEQHRECAARAVEGLGQAACFAVEPDRVAAAGRDKQHRLRRQQIALRRDVEFLPPNRRAVARVQRGGVHALRRIQPGGRVNDTSIHHEAGAHRPERNHPAVAGDAPVARTKPLAPGQAAGAGLEAVHEAVVAPEKQPPAREHRRVAHRPIGHERPLRLAGLGVDATDGVVRAGAQPHERLVGDRVVGPVAGHARKDALELLPVAAPRRGGPGRAGCRKVAPPRLGHGEGERLARIPGAAHPGAVA